jgi:putative ABC transport system permease protein
VKNLLNQLARSPVFTTVSVLTLALGIGANTAIFSVVNGVLLKPLPFEDPHELVGVWHQAPGLGMDLLNQSPALHFTYEEHNQVFAGIGMWDNSTVSVTGTEEPERVSAMRVTVGTLPVLEVQPFLGRGFTVEDDSPGTPLTVILSHGYWQRRFGGDPTVVGQTLRIEGRAREIIGVMPRDLRFLQYDPAVFLPFRFDKAELFFGNFSYQGVARLRPGVSIAQANAEVDRMVPVSLETYPLPPGFTQEMLGTSGFAANVHLLKEDVVGNVGTVLWVLLGTVGLVLLIACANVTNLFLVRAEGRQKEVALRTALGASRGRIARQFFGESVALGVLGGIAGLALAYGGVRVLLAVAPGNLPRLNEITIDPTVLGFTLVVSVVAGLLFGLFPVLHYGNPSLTSALKEGGRGSSDGRERHHVRNTLATSQVALASVLLIGSGLMIRSFQELRNVHPGFERPEEVMTFRVAIPEAEIEDQEAVIQAHQEIQRLLAGIPGVTSVGGSSSLTMDNWNANDPVFVEEFPVPADEIPPIRRYKRVTGDYFATMENPVLAGRAITWSDTHNRAYVAVLSETLAREYWDNPAQAIGKRVRESPEGPWREVIGVVGPIRDDGVSQEPTATIYWPMALANFWGEGLWVQRSIAYALRTSRPDPASLMPEVRRAVWSVNPNLPIASVRTMQEILDQSLVRTSFTLVMLGIAAAVAVLLGAIGIYGVISYSVSQRTREIGVRMALGARHGDVSWLVLRQGGLVAIIGITVGLASAVGLTRLMSSLLYGVSAVDPLTYILAAVGVSGISLLASYVPARRAASVDPNDALRWE